MRLADRHATWPVGKTSLHLDPHCDHHHLLQQCHPHIKQHHLGEIEFQRGETQVHFCNFPTRLAPRWTSKLPQWTSHRVGIYYI